MAECRCRQPQCSTEAQHLPTLITSWARLPAGIYMQQLLQQLPLTKTFDLYRISKGPVQLGGRVTLRMELGQLPARPALQEGAAGERG
jgi:hypothetical protein